MTTWRKSSYSNQEGACVEVEGTLGRVRDTKNPAEVLTVNVQALVATLRSATEKS
jgi:hypothetical protein